MSNQSDAFPSSPDELDALTGVLNRRSLYARCDELLCQCEHTAEPMTLLLLDIDCFRQVNYALGFDVGDQILRNVAREIRAAVPAGYFVGRIGGDEFVILLPNTPTPKGFALAEAIRITIQDKYLQSPERAAAAREFPEQKEPSLTISVIVASVGLDNVRTRDELFEAADEAMYWAKREGRNRVSAEPYPPKNSQA